MSVFMIGEAETVELREALARARTKPIAEDVIRKAAKFGPQAKSVISLEDVQREEFVPERDPEEVMIPVGYRVSITCEEQPIGLCAHISISSGTPGMVPRPEAINMVLDSLGLPQIKDGVKTEKMMVWLEEFDPGHHAVNVVVALPPETDKTLH